LFQKQVAEQIGVSDATIFNWERNVTNPPSRQIPQIIRFLGYNPLPAPKSLAESLIAARQILGLTQKAAAKKLGVDPTTLARWEKGKGRLSVQTTIIVTGFLKAKVRQPTTFEAAR
jgi:transcriptional regulator with XRE-family HTH domain